MKTKLKTIVPVVKDALMKACIYYTLMTLVITSVTWFLNQRLYPGSYFAFGLAALGAGMAVQIFKIEKLPLASRHIAFFILLYIDFLLMVFNPLRQYTAGTNTTFYLSVGFVVVYLVLFGMIMGIKAVINAFRNTRATYEKQFKGH